MERIYKYYPVDFGELNVRVIHMDLLFDVYDDHTYVTSDLNVRTLEDPIGSLDLNCRDLDIKKVSCEDYDVSYNYRKDEHILTIEFGCQVPPDNELVIHTETVLNRPGIYLKVSTMMKLLQEHLHSRLLNVSSGDSSVLFHPKRPNFQNVQLR
ncbi:MAG: hypothetical protein ACQESU_03500 [Halobacteriota archaeon]